MKTFASFVFISAAIAAEGVTVTAGKVEVVAVPEVCPIVRYAAGELTNGLARTLGGEVPVVTAPSGPGTVSIVLGECDLSREAGIDASGFATDEFMVRVASNFVFITGRDDLTLSIPKLIRTGSSYSTLFNRDRATLHGVYYFLERYAGMRFYLPDDELGVIVRPASSVEVPEGETRVAPDFLVREPYMGGDGGWYNELVEGDRARIKLKDWMRLRLSSVKIPCCHGTRDFRYIERFAETHPEYLALKKDGSRWNDPSAYAANQLCWTDPGFQDELYQDVKAYLTGQPASSRGLANWGVNCRGKYVDIMPEDSFSGCWCERCQAAYSHIPGDSHYATELIWGVTANIAQRLIDEGVDGNVTQMVYTPYRRVPDFALPTNVHVMVAESGPWSMLNPDKLASEEAEILAWSEKVGHKVWIWTYPHKFGKTKIDGVPCVAPHAWGRYFKHMSPLIFGTFAESESDKAIYNHLNYYVFSRVAWDVHADIDAILEEYYALMFGAAAAPMQAFFEELERKWMEEVVGEAPAEFRVWSELYSQEKCDALAALVDGAEALVPPGSMEARRIALMRREILDPLVRRSGKNWYVDPVNGLDTRDGTTSNVVSETTGPRRTLEKAMELVRDGDTLCLLPGEYREGSMRGGRARIYVTNNITVKSTDGASRTFISGVYGSPAMSCAHVTNGLKRVVFEGLTFKDGRAYGWGRFVDNGGGLKSESGGNVTWAIDCVFTNCYAALGGGMYGGNAYRCRFVDCLARDGGGFAAYSSAFAFCLFQGCSSSSCSAYKSYSRYSPKFYNCTFCGVEGNAFDMYSATSSETVTLCNSIVVGYGESGVWKMYATNCVLGATTLFANMVNCVSNVSVKASGLVAPERGDVRLTGRSPAVNRGDAALLDDVGIPAGYSLLDLLGRPVPSSGPIPAGCMQDTVPLRYGFAVGVW